MTKLAPEWVRTSDPVIRSPVPYRWTTAPAEGSRGKTAIELHEFPQPPCFHVYVGVLQINLLTYNCLNGL